MKLKFAIFLLLLSNRAEAVTATVTHTFSAGQKIVASQINTNYSDILTAINGQLNNANILDGGISTADLAAGLVTNAKLNTLNYASSTGTNYSNVGITATPIASKTITDVGRPVLVQTVNTQGSACIGSSGSSFLSGAKADASGELNIELLINSATHTSTFVNVSNAYVPCSSLLNYVYTGTSTGTVTYLLRGYSNAGHTINVCNCALFVREL